jgi:hypothetical protein
MNGLYFKKAKARGRVGARTHGQYKKNLTKRISRRGVIVK